MLVDTCGNYVFKISIVLTFRYTDIDLCILIIRFMNICTSILQRGCVALVGMVKLMGSTERKLHP